MVISGATSCFPNTAALGPHNIYVGVGSGSGCGPAGGIDTAPDAHLSSLILSLSSLKDKVHQVQSLVTMFLAPNRSQHPPGDSASAALASSMITLIQEIIVTASSMMFSCQQIALTAPTPSPAAHHANISNKLAWVTELATDPMREAEADKQVLLPSESFFWFGDSFNHLCNTINNTRNYSNNNQRSASLGYDHNHPTSMPEPKAEAKQQQDLDFDIIQLDAADLLAKYTHYCQVCGKGFKRDANLRMHMRAHGDHYKSSAALSNYLKKNKISNSNNDGANNHNECLVKVPVRKYSCPQEGCRWNRKHANFQPLKSMICVKNHYKRSHCPKMYVCKRCSRKQFSVLSDLRTHEKHCGDVKWQCSCGTTFSRKDKLMGHIALFVGHTPMMNTINRQTEKANNDQAIP